MKHWLMNLLVGFPTFLAFGYSLTFFGGVMGYASFYTMFPDLNTATTKGALKAHNSLLQGTANGASNLGGIMGCLACMYLGNKLGRRLTTFIGSIVCVVGTLVFCTAYTLPHLFIGRIIQGWGIGLMLAIAPPWCGELASTKSRGSMIIINGCMVSGGFAIASWITFGFGKATTHASWQWRVPGIFIGLLGGFVACSCLFFPESPRWLVLVGKYDDARRVLSQIRNLPEDSEEVSSELAAIVRANDAVADAKMTDMFKNGPDKMLWRLFLAVLTQFFTQANGAGIITSYSNNLFMTVGLQPSTAKIVAAVSLTFKFFMCFIAFFTIEKFGRRKLFIVSGAGMSICMFCLAICGSQTSPSRLGPAYASIAFIYIFLIFLPLAFLGVNFAFSAEIISSRFRAPASGISTAVLWLSQFVIALTTPLGLQVLQWKYYLVWGAVAALIVPVVYWYFPETTGLSMEELEDIWTVGGPRDAVREAKRLRALKAKGELSAEHYFDPSHNEKDTGSFSEKETVEIIERR